MAALPALPQASTSIVRGTVRDQTGALIPSASVRITNTGTNITTKTSTNAVGFFVFPSINPGPYRIEVEAPGMQKFAATLTVMVQQAAEVDAVLQVGQAATQVVVQDVTPVVTADVPTLGHVLERTRIEQLPINGRDFGSLLQTVPGMEGWRAFGLRTGSHEFMLDGAPMANRNTMMSSLFSRPPGLDTIQEFKVEVNNSSAKFTRPTTAIVTTKSGTNQIHGTAFETARNNGFGVARARTDYYSKPPQLIRNEFGASAGGPVYIPKVYNGKNRTFWFFAYEAVRNITPYTYNASVPTDAMRKGDFSGLVDSQNRIYALYDPLTTDANTWARQPFNYGGKVNAIDPARLNPLAKYLLGITPAATMPGANPLLESNWWGLVPNLRRNWTITSRFDHRFTDRDQFFARYTQGQYKSVWGMDGAGASGLPLNDGGVANAETGRAPNKVMAMSWIHTFSPTLFNELLASVSRERWSTTTGVPGTNYASGLSLPNPMGGAGWPYLYDTGLSKYEFSTQSNMADAFTYYIVDDNATKVHGKHEFQFGVHVRYDQLNILPDQQNTGGVHSWGTLTTGLYDPLSSRTNPLNSPYSGFNLANMYLGAMNYGANMVRGWFYTRAKEYALYFQDNFKITPRLTLNLGMRWERWPALSEKNHLMTSFDPQNKAIVMGADLDTFYKLGATMPVVVNRYLGYGAKFESYKDAGLSQDLMTSNSANFGPRVGFAYRISDGHKSAVLRGGYRMVYFPIPIRYWSATMRSNAPLTASFTYNLNSSSQAPDQIGNYWLRTPQTVFAGVNSLNVIKLDNPGSLSRGSAGSNFFATDQPDPRVQDWNLTLEKEVMGNTIARVAYVGNHGQNLEQVRVLNDSTPDYIWYSTMGTPLPTGEYSNVARRPFDQTVYGSLRQWQKTGWSNFNGVQMELERRYSKGWAYQLHYVVGNAFAAGGQEWSGTSLIPELNQYLPGDIPSDVNARNRFLNYQRDTGIPKHRVRWNWIVDLPFGKGKWLGNNAGRFLDKVIGGWQLAGMGNLRSTYIALTTSYYPTGTDLQTYGYKYPIQDCRSGNCYPGYLWYNGYIPANQINSVDAAGKPNGVMGVPADYKPAVAPLIPYPKVPDKSDPLYSYYGSNTTWVMLKNGTNQRVTYNDNLNPWRQQYIPSVRQWGLDSSLFKTIPINEDFRLRFSADFFNVLNHPGNPSGVDGGGILSVRSSGNSARQLQLTLRLSW